MLMRRQVGAEDSGKVLASVGSSAFTLTELCGGMTNEQCVRGRPDTHLHDCCDLHLAETPPLITLDNGSVSVC